MSVDLRVAFFLILTCFVAALVSNYTPVVINNLVILEKEVNTNNIWYIAAEGR